MNEFWKNQLKICLASIISTAHDQILVISTTGKIYVQLLYKYKYILFLRLKIEN